MENKDEEDELEAVLRELDKLKKKNAKEDEKRRQVYGIADLDAVEMISELEKLRKEDEEKCRLEEQAAIKKKREAEEYAAQLQQIKDEKVAEIKKIKEGSSKNIIPSN